MSTRAPRTPLPAAAHRSRRRTRRAAAARRSCSRASRGPGRGDGSTATPTASDPSAPRPTHGPIDRKAPVERTWLDADSWLDVVRGFAHDTDATFERLVREVSWSQNRQIRGGRKVDDPRLDGFLTREQSAQDPLFHFTRLILDARYRVRLSGPQLVYYRDGRDSMGFHRDDTLRWIDHTVIAGLAFGATRPFQLVSRQGGPVTSIDVAAGDLYVMGGRCQVDWFHGVPKLPECGPKISAVWRWTSRTGKPVEPHVS